MAFEIIINLIPTKYKNKLPKGFSYPVGAQEISEALHEIPQYGQFVLSFNDKDTFWSSKFKEKINKKQVIKILEIEYYRRQPGISSSRHMFEKGHYDPFWTFKVFALPTEFRHMTNEIIKQQVFPVLTVWLKKIGVTDNYCVHRKSYGVNLSSGEVKEIE